MLLFRLKFYPVSVYNQTVNIRFIHRRMKMNFGRAFTFAFEDPDWIKKVGIAAVVILIPVVGSIVLMGWGLEITRRVINNDPQPLPDWSDFGSFLSKGFQAFVAVLVYILPILVIYGCGISVTVGITAAAGNSDNADMMGGILTASMFCMYCFVFLFAILAGLVIPPALGNLAATGTLGAAFRFSEVFGLLRAAIGPYVLSVLAVIVASMVLSPLGSAICGIGVLATSAYLTVLSSHLYGQAYNVAKAAQSAAPVVPPM
jgi:hypothetical protein